MAQALEEFELKIEQPLAAGATVSVEDMESVKRTFRKRLQALAGDCLDLISPDLSINGFEPVTTRR